MNHTVRIWWTTALTATLAALYGWIGLAGHGLIRVLGIAGALLILAALLATRRSRPIALVMLAVGALPLAVAAWWSIVAPLAGLLVLLLGWAAVRAHTTAAANAKR